MVQAEEGFAVDANGTVFEGVLALGEVEGEQISGDLVEVGLVVFVGLELQFGPGCPPQAAVRLRVIVAQHWYPAQVPQSDTRLQQVLLHFLTDDLPNPQHTRNLG